MERAVLARLGPKVDDKGVRGVEACCIELEQQQRVRVRARTPVHEDQPRLPRQYSHSTTTAMGTGRAGSAAERSAQPNKLCRRAGPGLLQPSGEAD